MNSLMMVVVCLNSEFYLFCIPCFLILDYIGHYATEYVIRFKIQKNLLFHAAPTNEKLPYGTFLFV